MLTRILRLERSPSWAQLTAGPIVSGHVRTLSKSLRPPSLAETLNARGAEPVLATILSGHLKYLGQEDLSMAGRKWHADKFELRVPLHGPFLIRTSPEGFLLGFAPEGNNKSLSEEGLKLVSFPQRQEF